MQCGSAAKLPPTACSKLGNDGSVTKWTAIGTDLFPQDLTVFNNALWFSGFNTTTGQDQLYKLGFDGSVTKWTANAGSGGGLGPFNLTVFNDALWFDGATPANGAQLYKLGNDGSVTKWTSIGNNLIPKVEKITGATTPARAHRKSNSSRPWRRRASASCSRAMSGCGGFDAAAMVRRLRHSRG